ncbi:hypothetical protein GS924_06355, partial [Rhodococcus hoagii]|nr:hypothetical protein [Prescottella equi]
WPVGLSTPTPSPRTRRGCCGASAVGGWPSGERRRISRSDVAAHAGIDPAAVAAIEDGDLDALTVATVRAYTDTLGVGLRLEVDLGENRIHLA